MENKKTEERRFMPKDWAKDGLRAARKIIDAGENPDIFPNKKSDGTFLYAPYMPTKRSEYTVELMQKSNALLMEHSRLLIRKYQLRIEFVFAMAFDEQSYDEKNVFLSLTKGRDLQIDHIEPVI